MKRIRFVMGLAMAILIVLGISSCGKTNDSSVSSNPESTSTTTSESTPEVEGAQKCLFKSGIVPYKQIFHCSNCKVKLDKVTYTVTNDLDINAEISIVGDNSNIQKYTVTEPYMLGNGNKLEEKVSINQSYRILKLSVSIPQGNKNVAYSFCAKFNGILIQFELNDKSIDEHKYVHLPEKDSAVLADADINNAAVYGFSPNTTGSLKSFASFNWTDAEAVSGYKASRIKYHEDNDDKIYAIETKLRAEGKSIEEIARACSAQRNQNKIDSYVDNPEGLAALKARNLELYGDENGASPDYYYNKYGSWETVLQKSYSTNKAMDACCGLYDKYFYTYK